jgi:hypothetical protein
VAAGLPIVVMIT